MLDSARNYNAQKAGVDPDLAILLGPIEPVLQRLDPRLATPIPLSGRETGDLVQFLQTGLLDSAASPENLCALIPRAVPSGMVLAEFEGCGH